MDERFEQLDAVQRRRVRLAERRSVLVAGIGFTGVMAILVVSTYGVPGHWTTEGGATPWSTLVVTAGVVVVFVALLVPITRGRLESPGPRRDLVVSGDFGDIVRVARDLGTGRPLEDRSRTVARALLALTGRWVAWSLSVVGLAVVLGVLEAVVLPQVSATDLVLLALLVLGSLATLVWAVSARRHGSAQGLRGA